MIVNTLLDLMIARRDDEYLFKRHKSFIFNKDFLID